MTIDLLKYRWLGFRLMTGKLDWVLLRNCKVREALRWMAGGAARVARHGVLHRAAAC